MTDQKKERLMAVIGTEDTVTGFLLAGVGSKGKETKSNFMIVGKDTTAEDIEETFKEFIDRPDIAIILINQHIANDIRYVLDAYTRAIPAVSQLFERNLYLYI
eukprot:Awhi_evm1s9554